MRYLLLLGVLPLAACTTVPNDMAGFADVARESELIEVDSVGWGRSGEFTLVPIGVTGRFTRSANSWGANGELLAEGHVRFELAGGGEFGGLSGECAYSRETVGETEELGPRTTVETTVVTGPYIYSCGFYRAGEDIGTIAMRERPGRGLDIRSLRDGRGEIGDARLTLVSVHNFAGSPAPTESPLGYRMRFADGGGAMLYSNGATRRIALPRSGRDERAAALLSGLALTLVWDPGDRD